VSFEIHGTTFGPNGQPSAVTYTENGRSRVYPINDPSIRNSEEAVHFVMEQLRRRAGGPDSD
jgi:hypothetical protein